MPNSTLSLSLSQISANRPSTKLGASAFVVLFLCLGVTSCGTELKAASSLSSELALTASQSSTSSAVVTLPASASPSAAEPNVQPVRLTGSGFPTATIVVSGITVTLAPATPGAGPTVQTVASGFARTAGTIATVTFLVPTSLTLNAPTPYLASISGSTTSGTSFASGNTSALMIDPPASVAVNPGTGQQGQTLSVNLVGTFSNFLQGGTTANFGPGISVGGAAANTAGPVTVTSSTSATAQVVIAPNATVALNPVVVSTGAERESTGFSITTAAVATPASITATAGTPQSTAINTTFATNLQATVKDAGNNPLSGVTVTFAAPGSGASGSFAGGVVTAITNVSGVATAAVFTANGTAGSYSVTASVSGVGTPATFALTNTVGAPASITAIAGTPQSTAINTAFATNLRATVKDAGNNPLSGITVTFAAPGSGASGSFAGGVVTATTNASGIATAAVFTANGTAGSYSVTASASGVGTPATFALTNTVGAPASITATSGTPQSTAINTVFATNLQAIVKDAGNNPLSGVTVTFAAPGSGASGSFAGGVVTATTNASGIATAAVLTANGTAGSYSVTASVSGVSTPATFALTNTVGAPASITATSGTPQSTAINTAFATNLQAMVKDAGNNPLSGITVTFAAPGSGASGSFAGGVVTAITNASGIATAAVLTANGTAGSYSVTASVSGVSAPATFALTNTVGAPASITATAGTPQSTAINTAFATNLQATVKDAGNNPLSGITVTFAAPGSGASGSFAGGVLTATTNASGIATAAVLTANGTAGSYSVTASVSGVSAPATFALTNTVGAPASITATSGTPQSTAINTAFATNLQATVKDAGNNPLSGITVTFAAPGSGASGSFAGGVVTAITNVSGIATAAVLTANGTAGSYSVTASVSGVSTPATFALTNTVGAPASITATSGTPQSTAINTAFATNLQATVKDAGNNPLSGVTVTFAAPGSGASGSFAGGVVTATTNASGIATAAVFTANGTAGSYSVTASVSGVGTPATFALTNTPGSPASITATSGTPQSTAINTAFATNLQAIVKDAGNNPLSGVTVTFAAPGSGASGSFAGGVVTATTNASGIATAAVFTANGTAGSYSVTASVSGVSTPATFALTNTVGAPASITATSGTPQSTAINTAFATNLQATVKDAGNNPLSGITVTFAAPGSGASGSFAGGVLTATTNASGIATAAVLTANGTAGSYSVTASVSGVGTPATFALTNTVGAPASITATSGTPQSTAINTVFATNLQAIVKDAGNNPLSGVTVTFAAPGSGASGSFAGGVVTATTNASGIATAAVFTANGTSGSYNVTASVSGVGTPATFALTNTPGSPASITATSGTPQSTAINTAFATNLQALVKDAGNNPLSGITVTFAAPGSGASGSFAGGVVTATTNASGIATAAVFTANGTAGSYNVTASVSGVSIPATFVLTNTVGVPATIFASAGTPQSTAINTAFATNLQATVKDAGNNPLSGVTVTFAAPGSGASGSFAGGVVTATTNASGIATAAVFTANGSAGSYNVTASVSGVGTPAAFALTNTVGAPASITATSGTPQSTAINTAFATNLQATVKDAGNNPLSGITVTFAAPGSGASGSFAGNVITATTNANGIATAVTFTANAIAGSYTVSATAPGVGAPAVFSLTNIAGPASTIAATAGTPQSTTVNTVFATNLQATVKDSSNNSVSGVTVTFSAPGSGASGSFAGGVVTAITNASGVATAAAFTANGTAGSYNVTASAPGIGTPATFALTNTASAARSIIATGGTLQSVVVNTAFPSSLQATVKDAGNNPVSGVQVTFTAPGSGASGIFVVSGIPVGTALTATTNSSGIATAAVFTANGTAGSYSVTASTPGVTTPATFALTNTPGIPASILATAGTPQSAVINNVFPTNLQATVRDSGSNPVSGVTVTFSAPGSGASGTFAGGVVTATTNINGVAIAAVFTANGTAGSYSVTATVGGVSTPATFALTNTPGVPASIAPVGGTPQSATTNTAFASTLQARVTDSGGNSVSGITVTFTAPSSGASGTFAGGVNTAITNSSGIATSAVFTANGTTGGYQVVASVSGLGSTAVFALTNTIPTLQTLAPNFGDLAQTLNVLVTGSQTHFVQGTTSAYFGTGITVNSVTVSTSTSATVNITIAPTTNLGYRSVTMTTSTEVATYTNGFNVGQGSAALVSLNPNTGAQGTSTSVAVVGSNTNFQQGVTTANFGVNIGINSVTVTDLTHATVNITISGGATPEAQTVSLATGGEIASLINGFTVTAGTPEVTVVNPGSGNQGDTADSISITGQSTHWLQGTTAASFGSGVTVTSLTINSATSATAVIAISATAAIGNRMVTLTTNSEVANSAANAFSVAAGIPSATATPNFAIQGSSPTITINGSFTSFASGVTTVSFNDSNITVGTVTVNGPTQLSFPIQINTSAVVGARTITMNTNGNIVNASFNVTAGVPLITVINPNTGVPNSSATVTISGNFTSWVNGITLVSFGPGISVGGGAAGVAGPVTVNNSGNLTASIAIATGAAVGARTVTVTTNTEVETVASGFTVQTCTTTAAAPILYSPAQNATNVPLNTDVDIEFNAPLNRSTVTTSDYELYDSTAGIYLPAVVSVDASGRIITLTPSVLLGVGRTFYSYWGNVGGASNQIKDACGNVVAFSDYGFTTAFSADTTGPSLIANSPQTGDTVSESAQVVLQFSAPINPITQPSGFVVSQSGTPVAGTYTPSPDYTKYTFVPGSPLSADTTYTATYTGALEDGAGNALVNPGSFTFTTTSSTDTTHGTVLSSDPYNGQTGVSISVQPTMYFSKLVDPITLTTAIYLEDATTGRTIPATVSVGANRLSATISPLQPLQPNTYYYLYEGDVPNDLNGNYIEAYSAYFYTGNGPITSPATLAVISPANGQAGTPVNTQVVAVMSAPVDPGTITNSSITVMNGGTPVAGTVTLASDEKTLTFVPAANLSVSTLYSVTVGGFLDGNENSVANSVTSFSTGSSSTPQTAALTLVSISPVNGATGVANNASITLTFSAPVDPATINNANILVRDESDGYYSISGTWIVSGTNPDHVVFTPSTPYPASSNIYVYSSGTVKDLAGNVASYFNDYFVVANNVDTTPFQVVSISPASGATGVGRDATIVLTFNKSVSQSTLSSNNALQLFAGDTNVGIGGVTYSADGKTISFTPTTPAASVITINATPLIMDLSGNALVNFTSSYNTSSDITTTGPRIVQMLPASGSSDVLIGVPITLYTNGAALAPATVNNSTFYVSQNGILVQGLISVSPGGQSITFTPSNPLNYSAVVQVFAQTGITDVYGNPITAFTGQFTIQGNPSSVAPKLILDVPGYVSTSTVPRSIIPQYEFDQRLLASSVTSASVYLQNACGSNVPGTASVVNGNTVEFVPSVPLTPCNTSTGYNYFYFYLNQSTSKVTNLDGVAAPAESFYFYVAPTGDTTTPTVLSVDPPSGAQNVGVNTVAYVQFSELVDPISVNGSTVEISGGGQTSVPATISFDGTGTLLSIQPETPLPANTQMTISVNGVTNESGTAVTPYSSTFNTGSAAVTTAPLLVYESIVSGATEVPTNAIVSVQFNQPMAPTSFTSSNFYLYDTVIGEVVPTTTSVSSDGTTATLTPLSPLNVNREYYYYVTAVRGVSGNAFSSAEFTFTTESTTSAILPVVTAVNPTNSLVNVPTNTIVQLQFNEPIAPDTVSGVTINLSGSAIAATASFSNGNTLVSLTPAATLLPNTVYTISAANVVDYAGHTQTTLFSSTFTTGGYADLIHGTVLGALPAYNDTNVALNVQPVIFFSKQVNPISVTPSIIYLRNNATGATIPATVSVDSNQMSATLAPLSNLQPDTYYYLYVGNTYDVAGNYLSSYSAYFTTGAATTTTGASVLSISPPNGQTGVPLNSRVVAVMSAPVAVNTFPSSPITVNNGSTPVAGTTTLASDNLTMTFTPTANLSPSSVYTVTVGGFEDQNGNPVQTGSSTFTTGTVASSTLALVSISPANGTTLSSNTTPVVMTFSEPIDPATINMVLVRDETDGYSEVAGSWNVSGAVATFTPLNPYAANHNIYVYDGNTVLDFAGNYTYSNTYFIAANVADTTQPTVTSVTPTNGATGVGNSPPIVITFSKSINSSTVTSTSLSLFAGDSSLGSTPTFSSNGRSASFNVSQLPANTLITISASSAIQDLSGNALVPFQSTFTTGPMIPPQSQGPNVVSLIPANGATDISQGTSITLYTNGFPLSSSTVNSSSVQVSANGQLVTGTPTVVGTNGVLFTPNSPFPYSAQVQLYLTTAVTDIYGNPLLSAYSGSFTIQGNPASVAPVLVREEPGYVSTSTTPLNVVPQYQFDQPLLASSINSASVYLQNACGSNVAGTASLVNGNTVQFLPSAPLTLCNTTAGENYFYFYMNEGTSKVTNLDGVAAPAESFYFYVGTTSNTTRPTVVAIGPPAGTQNVGVNANIYVQFSAPINPLSANGSTISITSASQTIAPASIAFNSTDTLVTIQPSTPLAPNTHFTINVNAVTDNEANLVVPTSSTFNTGAGADLVHATVVAASFASGDTIPLNTTAFSVTYSEPMDPLSVENGNLYLYDETQSLTVTPVSVTSSDMMTFVLTISSGVLHSGDAFYLYSNGSSTDISGNTSAAAEFTGTVGSTSDTTAPSVTEISPEAGLSGAVPTNVIPQVEFNKEISNVSAQAGIQLTQGSTPVPATITLSRGDTVATITPTNPLQEATTYTISVTGVKDIQGTAMASAYTSNFITSSTGINLVQPAVVSVSPANGATGVLTTTAPTVVFTEAMDPITFDASVGYAVVRNNSNDVVVPATVTFSADGKTVTFTPTSALTTNTTYQIYIYYYYETDLAGNRLASSSTTTFTTGNM